MQKVEDIKPIVKGIAQLQSVIAGGIAVYHITATDGKKYQLEINVADKGDVGESATFNATEKALLLMRWIRKANEKGELILV